MYRIRRKSSTVIYELVTKFPPQIHQFPSISLVAIPVGCPWQRTASLRNPQAFLFSAAAAAATAAAD